MGYLNKLRFLVREKGWAWMYIQCFGKKVIIIKMIIRSCKDLSYVNTWSQHLYKSPSVDLESRPWSLYVMITFTEGDLFHIFLQSGL